MIRDFFKWTQHFILCNTYSCIFTAFPSYSTLLLACIGWSPAPLLAFTSTMWNLRCWSIPVGVASPILPVLHDGISRNLQFAILIQYASQFIAGLIAFTALPESHRPFREHRSLSGQFSDAGDDSILRTILVHEIVVGAGSHFTGEGSAWWLVAIVLLELQRQRCPKKQWKIISLAYFCLFY